MLCHIIIIITKMLLLRHISIGFIGAYTQVAIIAMQTLSLESFFQKINDYYIDLHMDFLCSFLLRSIILSPSPLLDLTTLSTQAP